MDCALNELFVHEEDEKMTKVLSDCKESEPAEAVHGFDLYASPPQTKVIKEINAPDTLETMYDSLKNRVDDHLALHTNLPPKLLSEQVAGMAAKVWVVRYVDFTSKYGMGFLFNTGSAGVYFNDSTKIVLSADGKVFQYTERNRDFPKGLKHLCQKHPLSSYPQELAKKVSLLIPFRNYLMEQQRAGHPSDSKDYLHVKFDSIQQRLAAQGACASVKYGQSSTRCNSLVENNPTAAAAAAHPDNKENEPHHPENHVNCEDCEDADMPFLKKWVRTKHAILFRMSNRTVQVVFFDRSEVLLSSEARVITYVSKTGQRSKHSLEDVLATGRVDIAKRLKYTKDIMLRLIQTNK